MIAKIKNTVLHENFSAFKKVNQHGFKWEQPSSELTGYRGVVTGQCRNLSNVVSIKFKSEQQTKITLEAFLADIEKKAYHIAANATTTQADAQDLLQDSMIKLVVNYRDRPSNEWKPLFYSILKNKIRDRYRGLETSKNVFCKHASVQIEEMQTCQGEHHYGASYGIPEEDLLTTQRHSAVVQYLKQLTQQERDCLILRCWEGFSVIQTANIMNCSKSCVKANYAKAIAKLKKLMGCPE
ncbi:sigma-70 family RNA polymerase sigma factor [Thalassomonas viridans]|uniref:Sigma-70 family RNA polymerase sigma factor n=1 Tax=Thalassomonas viridans TaxID=137584 RepID=A0AAE9Z9U3_9GAMM|nr:sigma-70 family RNA polymerase sigma factor [Thalassomonas viridans]WDE08675.1 sigma-70 family RNA polymerase sigma factor [Thalassomonas viridans]